MREHGRSEDSHSEHGLNEHSPHGRGAQSPAAHGHRPRSSQRVPSGLVALGVALSSFLTAVPARAQEPAAPAVVYQLDLGRRAHHELVVAARFDGLAQPVLDVRMSRSSPGRYALHEFAKNVEQVRAETPSGEALEVTRVDPYGWQVEARGQSSVIFRYVLFGDRVDGTYSAIDGSHAHLNGPSTYVWARGLEDRPIRVSLALPDGWLVDTQLQPTDDPATFAAPNLQYLMDSPLEASNHWRASWPVAAPAGGSGAGQEVAISLHHEGSEDLALVYAELAAAIVDEQIAIFGEPPAFDYGRYVFLADYLPWASGDGMEHRNSTILTSSSTLEDGLMRLLGTVSHEFFHAWNVERIRPSSLEPFDFERANMSSELWFGEGFTSYYDDLVLARSGILSFPAYVDGVSGLLSGFLTSSGRRVRSPVEMSHQAAFVDAASWIDRTNRTNNFISYYTYGAVLGLALDLELRVRFETTLDAYMTEVWQQFGRDQDLGRPQKTYTVDDLQSVLATLTNKSFANEFFDRHIRGRELPDYAGLLEHAGLVLEPEAKEQGWIGDVSWRDGDDALVVDGSTVFGSPLYEAGIDFGDRILEVNGEAVDREDLQALVQEAEPGSALSFTVSGRGREETVKVMVRANPRQAIKTYESLGREVTPEVQRFRSEWLGKKSERPLRARRRCPKGGELFEFGASFCPWHGESLEPVLPEASEGQRLNVVGEAGQGSR